MRKHSKNPRFHLPFVQQRWRATLKIQALTVKLEKHLRSDDFFASEKVPRGDVCLDRNQGSGGTKKPKQHTWSLET